MATVRRFPTERTLPPLEPAADTGCSRIDAGIGYRQPRGALRMDHAFDEEYLSRLAAGDPRVEKHFAGYFGDLLYLKLRRRLRRAEDIEDVRQETFRRVLAAVRTGSGVRDPERFGGFVSSVCNNVILEFRRKERRTPSPIWPLPELSDGSGRADSELLRGEIVDLVRHVLEELPERDRELLRAVFLEERDRAVVCADHGVARDYLRVALHRAKDRFRQRYRELLMDEARRRRSALGVGREPDAAAE